MNRINYFIGIDIASEDFAASIFTTPEESCFTKEKITNTPEGFRAFERWLVKYKVSSQNSVVCMEATGVYGETLCYYLAAQGHQVAVEPPLKVKRAFDESGHKTDAVDSRQIAEYAYRFVDELIFWQPNEDLVEQIRVLLSSRQQFTVQLTANQNSLHTLKRKVVQTPVANQAFQEGIDRLKASIKAIDQEIKRLISEDSKYGQMISLLVGIPGVGMLMAANLMVLTRGFTRQITANQLAAYIGICPYQHTSGKSVHKRARSRQYGPSQLRKLLYLAAMSNRNHNENYKKYFLRKVAEGKSKRLVLNNIANKMLKVICAMIRDQAPYIKNYQSVNPALLKSA